MCSRLSFFVTRNYNDGSILSPTSISVSASHGKNANAYKDVIQVLVYLVVTKARIKDDASHFAMKQTYKVQGSESYVCTEGKSREMTVYM